MNFMGGGGMFMVVLVGNFHTFCGYKNSYN